MLTRFDWLRLSVGPVLSGYRFVVANAVFYAAVFLSRSFSKSQFFYVALFLRRPILYL